MPVRATVCGLPGALSATLSEADAAEVAAGEKVTEIVQLPPAATVAPQLLVSANWVGLVPVKLMPVMLSAPLPLLLSVTAVAELVVPTGTLPKLTLLGLKPTPATVAVPDSATVWGLPLALSATDTVAA